MAPETRTVDEEIARIATGAHGVVTRAEMLDVGISLDAIKHRAQTGSLIRVCGGVCGAGHCAPSTEAEYLAAVRACGPGAVLYCRPAGWLLGLVKGAPSPPEVLAPTERRIKGVRTQQSRHIDRREVSEYRGVPVTTVPRTLVDLASVL